MAAQSSENVVESWAPEPELREAPPRRAEPLSSGYQDLNKPSVLLHLALGGVLFVSGLVLFFIGISHHRHILTFLGIVLALGGGVLAILYPTRMRSHRGRAEELVTYGIPVMARILHAENMTGDSVYGRTVKYQVVLPGGDLAHRTVNVDERLLPARLPADATALLDMKTSDVELYCALSYRALPKGEAVSRIPQAVTPTYTPTPTVYTAPTSTPAATGSAYADSPAKEAPTATPDAMPTLGGMGTLSSTPTPVRPPAAAKPPATPIVVPAPIDEQLEDKKTEKKGPSGLPWE